MKVTQEMIEEESVNQWIAGKTPRFVFIDSKSYDEFVESMKAKERNPMGEVADQGKTIVEMKTSTSGWLEIYKVETDKDFFEVL